PGDYTLTTTDGTAEQLAARHWRWTAPERAGVATLRFRGPASDDVITLRAFVMVPASAVKNGSLNGYRIGQYPGPRANPLYRPPEGYVEVTRDNQHTRVSPHFELGQFVCKEDAPSAFPKYVVVREQLPLTLEAVLERVEAIGFRADALHIMSAYRTPYYNHAIGDVKYSMHQFGGAADVYVDRMPDVKILFDQVEALMSADGTRPIRGGLGLYPGTTVHPPFVHVDVRGKAARWHG
ncbi:MAG TPA: D-Ala-D-Ala carboxypeptidase family metallohydrolase, partial [Vicinamibacterales bacterium]|nr:D-Ala-D-Ala carboxypeptidase family metallohydrolase [Vicinamibacterales bacterium]